METAAHRQTVRRFSFSGMHDSKVGRVLCRPASLCFNPGPRMRTGLRRRTNRSAPARLPRSFAAGDLFLTQCKIDSPTRGQLVCPPLYDFRKSRQWRGFRAVCSVLTCLQVQIPTGRRCHDDMPSHNECIAVACCNRFDGDCHTFCSYGNVMPAAVSPPQGECRFTERMNLPDRHAGSMQRRLLAKQPGEE
jgi:hypothetical protein